MRPTVALIVAGAVGYGAWTAWAQSVVTPTTPNPLPGSQFQGGDGNQIDAPGLIDWQGLQVNGRVGHTSDPQAQDDVFAGGTEELKPGGWALTTKAGGEAPPKDNILDIYRALDHAPGADAFLYLAFIREAGNGTTFLTFELNQNPLRWGPDQLPCRTTGDILITFDEQGNGVEVQVDRWVTDTTLGNGCANTGHLVTASNLKPNVDVQGSFNSAGAINNYLPGFLPTGMNTIPKDQFGETAINLTTVLAGLGGGCTVFGSSWAHSRSSLSNTSELKDYVAPQPFHVRTCKASPDLTSTASGLVNRRASGKHRLRRHLRLTKSLTIHDTATLSGGDNPTGPITFRLFDTAGCTGAPIFTDTHTANGAGSYRSADFPVTAPGTYHWIVEYAGDDNNNGAGPTACGDNSETVAISPATPTLTTKASGPVRLRRVTTGRRRHRRVRALRVHTGRAAQSTFDTATISGGIAPSGTVTFRLYGPSDPDCSNAPFATSTAIVNGNGTYASNTVTPTDAGTYFWVATYSGDTFNSSAGPTTCGDPAETIVIAKASPTISTETSGAVDLGGEIRDSATLSGGANPTGTITFDVYGPNNDACAGTPADSSSAMVTGNGTYASQPFKPTAVGTYRWIAHYLGDHNNETVATSCGDPAEAQVVGHPTVQPSLTTRAAASSALAPAGSPIRDAATLSGGSNPTGTITFAVYGPNDNSCATAVSSSTAAVLGNGTYLSATFTPT
jgi:hypothetical protein